VKTWASKVSRRKRARCEDAGEQGVKTRAPLLLVLARQWWVDVRWESPVSCLLKGSCNLMVDPKRVSVIQCDVTESVMVYPSDMPPILARQEPS
jgi:hypothetical protein